MKRVLQVLSIVALVSCVIALLLLRTPYGRVLFLDSAVRKADRVELFRLAGKEIEFDGGQFFSFPSDRNYGTYGAVSLSASEKDALADFFDSLDLNTATVMCIMPEYGVRLWENEEVVSEITISFSCTKISMAVPGFGLQEIAFNGGSNREETDLLFHLFNERLPSNPNFLEEREEAIRKLMESAEE